MAIDAMKMLGCSFILLVAVLLAAACDGRGPTTPTSPSAPPAAVPSPPRQSMSFEMTGVVTDDDGPPVPGAKVAVWRDYVDVPSMLTDGSGAYKLKFTAVPGSAYVLNWDPAGTEDAVAFVTVEASGYEPYARYILGTTQDLVENIRLHRIKRITAGESAVLTIVPDDTVCVLDVWPGRELICGTLRVVAPDNGIMTVEAVPTQATSELPMLEFFGNQTGAPRANPTALRVTAGIEYTIKVEVPRGFTGSQSFVVKTSMTVR
jgi:hypothetical protein